MKSDIRWGILACGKIARKFASDLQFVSGSKLVAAGSRAEDNARKFANEFSIPHIHGSYDSLVNDPEVDVIYVASPHGQHHEHVLLCLNNNKAVLCEKAFAINWSQAKEMIDLARDKKLFLMEALWTKFLPHFQTVMDMLRSGKLGKLRNVLVNFGFIPPEPVPQRLYDPALGGGSLLDIGIYCVFIAISALGRPDKIEALMSPAPTGVDEQLAVNFEYAGGQLAQLFSSFSTNLPTEAEISGDQGRIRLTSRFYEPGTTIEYYPGKVDSRQIIPFHKEAGSGYQFQARHVVECLRMGLTESPVMRHEDSLLLMETMDRIRSVIGLRYAADKLS
jgi:predicted dehydrogenase